MQGNRYHIVIQSSALQRALVALDTAIAFSAFELDTHLLFLPEALVVIEDSSVQERLELISTLDTSTLWLAASTKDSPTLIPDWQQRRFLPDELAAMLSRADQVLSF